MYYYQWFLEKIGNNVYRTVSKSLNVAIAHDPKQNTVNVGKEPAEWSIEETDVLAGVYRSVCHFIIIDLHIPSRRFPKDFCVLSSIFIER